METTSYDEIALRNAIIDASISQDNDLTVIDCIDFARKLAPFFHSCRRLMVVAYWQNPYAEVATQGDREMRVTLLKNASFLLEESRYALLEDMKLPQQRDEVEWLYEIATNYGFDRRNLVVNVGSVICFFDSGCQTADPDSTPFSQATQHLLASCYQNRLFSSSLFASFLNGAIYRMSRPAKYGMEHPKFRSCAEIADAVAKIFDVATAHFVFTGRRSADIDACHFRNAENKYITGSLFDDPGFRKKLHIAIAQRQNISGVTANLPHTYFCIHPAYEQSHRGGGVEGVIIVWSERPINLVCYIAAQTWLREFSAKRHLKKADFLSQLGDRADEILNQLETDGGYLDRQKRSLAIEDFTKHICKNICELTNADVAVFRLCHNSEKILRLYAKANTPLGNFKSDIQKKRPNYDIRMAEWHNSTVAFAFHPKFKDQRIYIKDVTQMPQEYQKLGLNKILQLHENTICEAVLKVKRGNLLAAVINVESSIEDGLTHDLNFLQQIADITSDFLTRLEVIGDRGGLASMTETHMNLHAVKGEIGDWDGTDSDSAIAIVTRLKQQLKREAPEHVDTGESIKRFNLEQKNLVKNALQRVSSAVPYQKVLKGNFPLDMPVASIPSMRIIMDSIWNNIRKYSYLQNNRVVLSTHDQAFGGNKVLSIEWIPAGGDALAPSIDQSKLFLQPLNHDGAPHFGFFLLGVHTRLLGGHVELRDLRESRSPFGFRILILLPYHSARR